MLMTEKRLVPLLSKLSSVRLFRELILASFLQAAVIQHSRVQKARQNRFTAGVTPDFFPDLIPDRIVGLHLPVLARPNQNSPSGVSAA